MNHIKSAFAMAILSAPVIPLGVVAVAVIGLLWALKSVFESGRRTSNMPPGENLPLFSFF